MIHSSQGVNCSPSCVWPCHVYRWQRRSELSFLAASNTKHTHDMKAAATTVSRTRKEIKLSPSDEIRFWEKVNKNGPTQPHMTTPCWLWTGGKSKNGYGGFNTEEQTILAHRAAWVIANGQIPHDGSFHGICVCHKCDVKACCNPSHLFLGTAADNMRDKDIKGRQPRGEARAGSKLTSSQVLDIRSLYKRRVVTQKQISVRFGVCRPLINMIINRKIWCHI